MAEESDLLDGGFDLFTVLSFFQFNDCDALHYIKIKLLLWKVVVIVINSGFNSDHYTSLFIYLYIFSPTLGNVQFKNLSSQVGLGNPCNRDGHYMLW